QRPDLVRVARHEPSLSDAQVAIVRLGLRIARTPKSSARARITAPATITPMSRARSSEAGPCGGGSWLAEGGGCGASAGTPTRSRALLSFTPPTNQPPLTGVPQIFWPGGMYVTGYGSALGRTASGARLEARTIPVT